MSDPRTTDQPTILIEQSSVVAHVVIPPTADPALVNLQYLLLLGRERGLEMNSGVETALRAVADRFRENPSAMNEIIAVATPPEHGRDGFVEWRPGFDPGSAGDGTVAPDPESGKIDYYARRSFIRVRREDHIATIVPPTDGVDGRDVCGRTLAAAPGKQLTITTDASLERLGDGRLIAQIDGQLAYDGRRLSVNPVLEVRGTVDFSTGNIDFEGDVVIRRDVRDKFTVRATRSVSVDGLVDASHISCGGSLTARRGIAGRGEGTVEICGDAQVGYLDEVSGHIGGNLICAREIMRCRLFVAGDLLSDRGSLIGGCVTVAGNVRLAELGSGSDTPTELRLSQEPDKQSPAGKAAAEIRVLNTKIAGMEREIETLQSSVAARAPTVAERMSELASQVSELQAQVKALTELHPGVADASTFAFCSSTLEVQRLIHARVTLRMGHHVVFFNEAVKGPVRIWLEGPHNAMCQLGEGASKPLRTLGGVVDRAAA